MLALLEWENWSKEGTAHHSVWTRHRKTSKVPEAREIMKGKVLATRKIICLQVKTVAIATLNHITLVFQHQIETKTLISVRCRFSFNTKLKTPSGWFSVFVINQRILNWNLSLNLPIFLYFSSVCNNDQVSYCVSTRILQLFFQKGSWKLLKNVKIRQFYRPPAAFYKGSRLRFRLFSYGTYIY